MAQKACIRVRRIRPRRFARRAHRRVPDGCGMIDYGFCALRGLSMRTNDMPGVLGVVGAGYEALQNASAFAFCDAITDSLRPRVPWWSKDSRVCGPDDQRPSRDADHEASLPRGVRAAPVHYPGRRFLRMAPARREAPAALLHPPGRRRPDGVRRAGSDLAQPRRRPASNLLDRHHKGQPDRRAAPRSHAGESCRQRRGMPGSTPPTTTRRRSLACSSPPVPT
jgi:hypothetical protein